jgi:hypothetical protein
MRTTLTAALAAVLCFAPSADAANDAALAEIRAQVKQMKESYEQRIAALESRLADAEKTAAKAEATAVQVATAPPPAAPAAAMSAFNPEISVILQGQYKNMKDIPERGITGFWPANGHSHGDDHSAEQRGFSIDHSELVFTAGIDPYWRGNLTLGIQDNEVEVEEAWFQSLAIGHGLGLKGGRFRSGIGYLNDKHPHAWDFADAPLMYQVLFGSHASYTQDGAQLKWVAPSKLFVEIGLEAGRGSTYPGTDENANGANAGAAYVKFGGDVGAANSWLAGLSYLQTSAKDREAEFEDVNGLAAQGLFDGTTKTWIADFVWKWAPDGNPSDRNFKLQGEYFRRTEKGELDCLDEEGVGNACDPAMSGATVLSNYDTRQSGWYLQGIYQFTPNWRAGLRYDRLDSGRRDFGVNENNLLVADYRPQRATVMADYSWSEFARMRLQYAQDRSMQGVTDNQVTLQYIMSMGSHGAHKF